MTMVQVLNTVVNTITLVSNQILPSSACCSEKVKGIAAETADARSIGLDLCKIYAEAESNPALDIKLTVAEKHI